MTAAFLMRLSAGITLMWLLMPRRDVTDGFFRIQMRVVLGIAVLTALLLTTTGDDTAGVPDPVARSGPYSELLFWLQSAAAVITYSGSPCWALSRRRPGTWAVIAVSIVCTASLAISEVQSADAAGVPLQLVSGFASAAVLGSVLTAMLLGHWYLTSPTMTLRPLQWFSIVIAVAAAIRLLATGVAVGLHRAELTEMTHLIWLGLRIAGGILAPAGGALLVYLVLRFRNTQSATGVLFAGLIMVFMGEMSAALLERELGIPF